MLGEGVGQVGLVGEVDGYCYFGGGYVVGEECFGVLQMDGYQYLMGCYVIVGFKLVLKVVWVQCCYLCQFVEGDGMYIVIVQVVVYVVKVMFGFILCRGMVGQRVEGVDEVEQQFLLGQWIVVMLQVINQLVNLLGMQRIFVDYFVELLVLYFGDGFKMVWFQINYLVVLVVGGFCFVGVQFVGIYGDN